MSKSIECPHCEGDISKGYAIKALAILAKSEGIDIGEELETLAGLGEPDAEKGDVGNKRASHRGKAPGAMHSSSRANGTGRVERTQASKKNKLNSGGVRKSLNLPIIVGEAQLVDYGHGADDVIAKGIEAGNLHTPVARNLRAEVELATGEATPE